MNNAVKKQKLTDWQIRWALLKHAWQTKKWEVIKSFILMAYVFLLNYGIICAVAGRFMLWPDIFNYIVFGVGIGYLVCAMALWYWRSFRRFFNKKG